MKATTATKTELRQEIAELRRIAAIAKIAELEQQLAKSECCDPLAPLATCAYCEGTVHTCERKESVNNDYRCPAHPDDRQDGDKWFCSESCQQQFTLDALTDQLADAQSDREALRAALSGAREQLAALRALLQALLTDPQQGAAE